MKSVRSPDHIDEAFDERLRHKHVGVCLKHKQWKRQRRTTRINDENNNNNNKKLISSNFISFICYFVLDYM